VREVFDSFWKGLGWKAFLGGVLLGMGYLFSVIG